MAVTLVGSSGVSGGTISGGSQTLTWATAPSAGDVCLVFSVDTQTSNGAKTILTGSGAAYTTLLTTSNGNLRSRLAYRVAGTGETTATCSHSGAAADACLAIGFVFRGVSPNLPSDIQVTPRNTGTSSQPDSTVIKAHHSGCAIVSAVCALANNSSEVVAPTGYLNMKSTGVTDTRSCQAAMSWVVSTNDGTGQVNYDPTAYSSFTSAAWMGFTIVLESTDPYIAFDLGNPSTLSGNPWMSMEREVVAYGNVQSRSS